MALHFVVFEGVSLTSKLIKFFTRSRYSHVAYYPDPTNHPDLLIEVWPRPAEGVLQVWGFFNQRWDFSSLSNHTPGTVYEVWRLECDSWKEALAHDFYLRLARSKAKYDWWGVVGFVVPLWKGASDRWFCSEGLIEGLRVAGIVPSEIESWRYSPEMFVELVCALGAVKVKRNIVRR